MKVGLMIALLFGTVHVGISPAQNTDLEQLQAAYEKLNEARNRGDVASIDRAVDDRAILFSSDSQPTDIEESGKDRFLNGLREFFAQTEHFNGRALNPQYRIVGDTGIVRSDVEVSIRYKDGHEETGHRRAVHIFAKTGLGWRVVAGFNDSR